MKYPFYLFLDSRQIILAFPPKGKKEVWQKESYDLEMPLWAGGKIPDLCWEKHEKDFLQSPFSLILSPTEYCLAFLSLPSLPKRYEKQTLKFQAENLVPALTAEEMILDYVCLERNKEGKNRYLLVILSKEKLKGLLEALEEKGLSPFEVIPAFSPMASFLSSYQDGTDDNPKKGYLLINSFSPPKTFLASLWLWEKQKLLFTRDFLFRDFSQLEKRVQQSLAWIGENNLIPFFYLVHPKIPQDPIFSKTFQENLHLLEEKELNLPPSYPWASPLVDLSFLGACQKRIFPLDFRQDEFESLEPKKELRKNLLVFLFLLNLSLFFGFLGSFRQNKHYQQKYQKIIDLEKKWWAKIFPERKRFSRQLFLKLVERKIRKGEESNTSKNEGKMKGFLYLLEKVGNHLPSHSPIRFRKISFQKNLVTFTGVLPNKEVLLALKEKLQKKEGLEVKWDLTKIQRPGRVAYRFNLRVQEGIKNGGGFKK